MSSKIILKQILCCAILYHAYESWLKTDDEVEDPIKRIKTSVFSIFFKVDRDFV